MHIQQKNCSIAWTGNFRANCNLLQVVDSSSLVVAALVVAKRWMKANRCRGASPSLWYCIAVDIDTPRNRTLSSLLEGTYLKLSQFLSKTVADCLKLSQSSKIVAMCLNLSLILSHVPAPKAYTSQGTIHGYVHSWNDLAQPDPDPTGPLLPHHPARSSLPPQLHPARQCPRRPGPPCPPNRPAVPADPARHARRPGPPCPPTRPAVPADPARQARRPGPPSPPTRPAEPASRDMSAASAAMPLTRPASYLPASCSSAPVSLFPVAAV